MNARFQSPLQTVQAVILAFFALASTALTATPAHAQVKVLRGYEIVLSWNGEDRPFDRTKRMLSAAGLRMPPRARVAHVSPFGNLAVVDISRPGSGEIGEVIRARLTRIDHICSKILALNPRISMDCEANVVRRIRSER